jgi:hypothetical protein
MIASKVICDDTYSNKSWCIVGQGMFALREINQMEREMCSYLEWELNVDPKSLQEFEHLVRKEFYGPGPYTAIPLPTPSKPAYSHGASVTSGIAFLPTKPAQHEQPISTSPPKPMAYPEHIYRQEPPSPSTPEMSRSETPSPASTRSPQTPESAFESHPQIIGAYPDFPPKAASPRPSEAVKAAQIAKAFPSKHAKPAPKASMTKITADAAYAYARATRW